MDVQVALALIAIVGSTITAVVGGWFLLVRQTTSDESAEERERGNREAAREARLDKLSTDLWNQFTEIMVEKDRRIDALEKKVDMISQENEDMVGVLSSYRETVEAYRQKQQESEAKIDQLERDREELLDLVDAQTTQLNSLDAEMRLLIKENETLARQVAELQRENTQLRQELDKKA